jgi:putative membrane protein
MKTSIQYFTLMLLTFLSFGFTNFSSTGGSKHIPQGMRAWRAVLAEDEDFVKKAAEGGMMELKAAELAVKTSTNAGVKSFAQAMIKDHGKANTELQATAKKKGIATPTSLSQKNEQKLKDLSSKKGAAFDAAYALAMVNDHKEVVALFKSEASGGKDPDLKSWAAEKLPTLEHHLSMAQDLANANKQ